MYFLVLPAFDLVGDRSRSGYNMLAHFISKQIHPPPLSDNFSENVHIGKYRNRVKNNNYDILLALVAFSNIRIIV